MTNDMTGRNEGLEIYESGTLTFEASPVTSAGDRPFTLAEWFAQTVFASVMVSLGVAGIAMWLWARDSNQAVFRSSPAWASLG